MKTARWLSWLQEWLTHHPLKAPPPWLGASYGDEVMARVRSLGAPSPAWRYRPRPRWVLAYGASCAAVLVAAIILVSRPDRLIGRIEHEAQVLVQVEDDPLAGSMDPAAQELDEELRIHDRLMVADAEVADDQAWIDHQAAVLSDLEEDPAADPAEEAGEAWLEELRWLDDAEVAAS